MVRLLGPRLLARLCLALLFTVCHGQVCVNTAAKGYYTVNPTTFHSGLPTGQIPIPSTLTYCELAQLQQDCIDRINQYRAGTLKFSDGTVDPGVPKPSLGHLMGNDACSAAQAAGDLRLNGGAGGCTGAHATSFSCPWGSSVGQNTCCYRTGSTYTAIKNQLFSCLQQMWDEGIGLADNAAFTSANGHWYNMRKSSFTYAHCGFAFDNSGHVWMNQDFTGSKPASVSATCSCLSAGDSDGCGGTCVTASGSTSGGGFGPSGGSESDMTPGLTAGIALAVIAFVVITVVLGVFHYRRTHSAPAASVSKVAFGSAVSPAPKPTKPSSAPVPSVPARGAGAGVVVARVAAASPRQEGQAAKPVPARPAVAASPRKLPPGWAEYTDPQGNIYFHNEATGVSTWERPVA